MFDGTHVFSAEGEDEARAFLAAKNLSLRVAGRGRTTGAAFAEFKTSYAPGVYLARIGYGAEIEIGAPAERADYGFSAPLSGRMAATVGPDFVACTERRTVLGSPGAPQTIWVGCGARRLAVSLGRDVVRSRLAALTGAPVAGEIVFDGALDLETGAGRIALDAMRLVAAQLDAGLEVFADPLRAANFEDVVLTTLLLYQPHSHMAALSRAPCPSSRDVKRAVDFIEANLDAPLRLEEIVAAAGVSGRALSEHFRRTFGLSPMAYLRRARLGAVREALSAGDAASVTDAAMRYGFLHMGRFSAAYRDAWGESPSATLLRARRRDGTHIDPAR